MAKNKGGRPQAVIDKDHFERLCIIQPTLLEVSAIFGVDKNTIMSWCKRTYKKSFSEVFAEKRAKGKVSLRRALWQLGIEKDNVACLIFLAKNHLGMSDNGLQDDDDSENDLLLEFNRRENI